MKKVPWLLGCVSFLLLSSCALDSIPKSLDPESREFLSKARYLVNGDERRAFLGLSESERPNFIEEFWKKRDPDPTTEVNEFKVGYFRRIDEANRLFKEGTTPGWLQDRGRLYVLLGPPDNRETYPRGPSFYGVPTEVWYYGFFRVVFVDAYWTGDYRLDPDSPAQVAEIVKTQVMRLPKVTGEKGKEVLDARFEVKPVRSGETLLRLKIPYKNIWFKAEGNMLKSTLELKVELLDSVGKKAWDFNRSYSLALDQNEFLEDGGGDYLIEVTVEAPPGTYTMSLNLKNTADGSQKQIRGQLTLSKSSSIIRLI